MRSRTMTVIARGAVLAQLVLSDDETPPLLDAQGTEKRLSPVRDGVDAEHPLAQPRSVTPSSIANSTNLQAAAMGTTASAVWSRASFSRRRLHAVRLPQGSHAPKPESQSSQPRPAGHWFLRRASWFVLVWHPTRRRSLWAFARESGNCARNTRQQTPPLLSPRTRGRPCDEVEAPDARRPGSEGRLGAALCESRSRVQCPGFSASPFAA
jgi:hypothetical protein